MCLTFKESNEWRKKPVNPFSQDGTSAGMRSLQTSIIKLCQMQGNGLEAELCLAKQGAFLETLGIC